MSSAADSVDDGHFSSNYPTQNIHALNSITMLLLRLPNRKRTVDMNLPWRWDLYLEMA
ncbi:hypothetical protein H0H93_004253 [Arthromyces matolae]|nr:hypothetical protein H0H93_004253 [Arthromyces matolae]